MEEATAFKRDYEERAKELAEDIAFEESAVEAASPATALFTDAAAQRGRRSQGARRRPPQPGADAGLHRQHVLGVPELHHGAERHLREVRHVREHERV